MGACFAASWISWPRDKSFDDWKAAADKAIGAIQKWEDLDEPEWMENVLNPDLVSNYQNDPKALREMLREQLDEIDPENSEVGAGCMGNREFIITGGMTWGDDPTEVFTSFNVVNAALGVLEVK